ncbi:MAG: DUF1116 domain-containing protein [Actinomycetota bacterium]
MNATNGTDTDRPPRVTLPRHASVVNVGLAMFAEALQAQHARVVDVDWRIPAGGDESLVRALTRLYGPAAATVEEANREAVRRLDEATPALVAVRPAGEVVPDMGGRTVLHPGPPLDWEEFCDPLRRSVLATVLVEGWADDRDGAARLVAAGGVDLTPANDRSAAVPLATTLGPSAPVLVVENDQGGNTAYTPLNQGPGQRQWLGADSDESVRQLRWLRDVAGPLLDAVLSDSEPVDLFSIAAQGVQMGDDIHMRLQASTNLLIRAVLPRLAALDDPRRAELAQYLSENYLFFLNPAIAAAKATADWAAEVPGATVVTGMARNGTTFGIRLAATGDRWFLAPAPPVEDALYRGDFGPDDAAPDIGDSAIIELVGLGGAAAAASPAVAGFVGGRMSDAVERTREVSRICASRSSRFKIPQLDFTGTPLGIDVRKVVELEAVPAITTGILDASEGRGQVGAGLARAPLECFQQAVTALSELLA